MEDRLVYFYTRDNKFGYDRLSILAFSQTQADAILKMTVIRPEEWKYSFMKNIDYDPDLADELNSNKENNN